MEIKCWVDGSCRGNGKENSTGGWSVIINQIDSYGLEITYRELSGTVEGTTNNQMELRAVLECLSALYPTSQHITIYTDSLYVKDGIDRLPRWIEAGWYTMAGKPVANIDLWKSINLLVRKLDVHFIWVRGHDVDTMNKRADKLAQEASGK